MKHRLAVLWVWLLVALTSSAWADVRPVEVGPGFQYIFRDVFSGTNITMINVGDTVRWVWRTGYHTTTSYDGLWDAEISSANRSFDYTFNYVGIYRYYCIPHELLDMVGEVRVRLAGDVNSDKCINDKDLALALFAFSRQGRDLREDVNYDGIVNNEDLLIVLRAFGQGC